MSRHLAHRMDGRELVRDWISPNTRRAYTRSLEQLSVWLAERGLDLCDEAVADYLTEMFDAGLSPRTGGQVVSAVRFQARLTGAEPAIGPKTRLALSRFARMARGRGRGQAQGVQWEEADRIARESARDGLTGLRDAAVVAVMSDGLLRVSEAAAIEVEHITPLRRGGATLYVPHSKTDPTGEGRTVYLGPPSSAYAERWQEAAGLEEGFLFRALYRDIVQPGGLTARTITNIVKRRARECGIDRASGHSLRVGSAQSLAAGGATLVEMQLAGRWRDPRMPEHYAQAQLAERGAVARIRYGG